MKKRASQDVPDILKTETVSYHDFMDDLWCPSDRSWTKDSVGDFFKGPSISEPGRNALTPVTGLTHQRNICCLASYWSCPHNLSSYWPGSQSLNIIVLSRFPTPVSVKLKYGKVHCRKKLTLFKRMELGQETIQSKNKVLSFL